MAKLSSLTKAFVVNKHDNVATLTSDCNSEEIELTGDMSGRIKTTESIKIGHKVAIRPLLNGDSVIKYEVVIGAATSNIMTGQWVHLHNCKSNYDTRSSSLDLHSGTPVDTNTAYE